MILTDLRHGVRLLLRAPGFALIAVAALAIGIGANTAIFSVVNTVLLQEPPYADPDRLVIVWEHNLPRDRKNNVVSPGNFLHWRDMNQSFDGMAAFSLTRNVTVTGAGEPEEFGMQYVTAAFFPVLGVRPQLGRAFSVEEDRPGNRVVIISDRLWRRRFNADAAVLSRPITIQGVPFTVLGVMPPGFSFFDAKVDLWVPPGFPDSARTPRGRWLMVVARLKPGVTAERAQQDMTRVAGELTRMFPEFDTGWTARVVPLRVELAGPVRPALLVLLGAVAFVLLIACANVANLLLARATARQRELAVRAALGAGRGRLVRQMLAESAILAAAGGLAGLLLAWWGLHLLRLAVAQQLPVLRLDGVGIDGWVLAFTVAVSLLSGVFFGIVPAWSASGHVLTGALREGGRGATGARGRRTRGAFVVAEVALALVLLVGAGLLVRSFMRLLDIRPGFDASRTVTMRVTLPAVRYDTNEKLIQFFTRVFGRIDALPGVEASGGTTTLPLTGLGSATGFTVVGQPAPPLGSGPVTDVRIVANDYFKAMSIPLVAGRLFVAGDEHDRTSRIVVNEALARKHFPGENPIGKRIVVSWNENVADEIIGVVGDVRQASLDTEARATVYWPYEREPYIGMGLAIRAAGDPLATARAAASIIREADPELAVADIRTMEEVVALSVAQQRLTMLLLTVFAAAALLLAAVGIYGVISYSVTERRQEIGIRMALGAQRGEVLRMVVVQAMALAIAGIVIGGAAAFLLTRAMSGLLFEVKPGDPLTFASVAVLLGAVAAVASLVPGRRATRVDPAVALRAE